MTKDCDTCGGQSVLGVDRIGPEEFRTIVTCGDCDHGQVPVPCHYCGEEATREAWVLDSKAPRKASLLYLCETCHDHDETRIVEWPTRCLPARQADADIAHGDLARAIDILRAHRPRQRGVGHA